MLLWMESVRLWEHPNKETWRWKPWMTRWKVCRLWRKWSRKGWKLIKLRWRKGRRLISRRLLKSNKCSKIKRKNRWVSLVLLVWVLKWIRNIRNSRSLKVNKQVRVSIINFQTQNSMISEQIHFQTSASHKRINPKEQRKVLA